MNAPGSSANSNTGKILNGRKKTMLEPMDSFSAWIMIAFFAIVFIVADVLDDYLKRGKVSDIK